MKYFIMVRDFLQLEDWRKNKMQNLQVIEVDKKRVLTTHQIAEAYCVKEVQISQNFKNNRERFVEGKHYISLTGDELKIFKKQFEKIEVVKNRTSHLYLWTEKGALLHAKSLNTDKAWEVYDWLVDFYFRAKDIVTNVLKESVFKERKKETRLDIPNNKSTQEKMARIDNLCVSMRCVLTLYNRYLELDEAASMQKALYAIGAEICSEAFRLKNIKVDKKRIV